MNPNEPATATTEPDALVRGSTIVVVVFVALGAAFVSYRHAYDLVHAHGESGLSAAIGPATVDGLIYAAGMVLLSAARRRTRPPRLAYVGLWLGIAATIGANVAHGLGHGPIGALVSAWPAVALIISYELLMRLIRSGRDEVADAQPEPVAADAPPCPHEVAATVQDAAVNAFLHARDCLGEETSQRRVAAAFKVDRKKLAAWLGEVAQPDSTDAGPDTVGQIEGGHPAPVFS
jgi:hypothetical protein